MLAVDLVGGALANIGLEGFASVLVPLATEGEVSGLT